MLRTFLKLLLIGLAGLLFIQLVPYGRDHSNPPVVREPNWDSPRTRELAVRACFDCHSNETRWPWYSHVAPVSWLLQWDVEDGRRIVNFSEWHPPQEEASESARTVIEGEMPPWYYGILHARAHLSSEEKEELIRGLDATFGPEQERSARAPAPGDRVLRARPSPPREETIGASTRGTVSAVAPNVPNANVPRPESVPRPRTFAFRTFSMCSG